MAIAERARTSGPGATLIFEVELLSIQDKAKTEVTPNSSAREVDWRSGTREFGLAGRVSVVSGLLLEAFENAGLHPGSSPNPETTYALLLSNHVSCRLACAAWPAESLPALLQRNFARSAARNSR